MPNSSFIVHRSSFIVHHSKFAAGARLGGLDRAHDSLKIPLSRWESTGDGFGPKAKKETPGPLNRKRSRKGSWGQRRKKRLAGWASQILSRGLCDLTDSLDRFAAIRNDGLRPWIADIENHCPKNS